ncbi:MAG: molybdopterin-synthase adenylyltransferase MoeB [Candidatus Eremiobacteraeota bacterium]|nr:molybdopterin-synthase adenylyltransferase MoeB [Candidatus Eremiobacteraeota bacterium]MBC5828505.1 molybdopterin-synthase adenylyltransferase MoeB [Candidatus Eremiobacteraeota bacterium]
MQAALDPAELSRYSRHIMLPEVGIEGQRKLKNARVILVGAGGLGTPAVMYLAAAGVGTLGIVDHDLVDESNLQRQVIHSSDSVGMLKTRSARISAARINPKIEVITHDLQLRAANARDVLAGYDIVIDGTDNFPTRYLVSDACVLLGKPNVYGSIQRFEGQASVFDARRGPCYRCLFPEPPPPGSVPSCSEAGVLGVLPGIVGLVQSTETIKLILGIGESLIGRLLLFDALEMRFREMKLRKDPDCPSCGNSPSVRELVDYEPCCANPPQGQPAATTDHDITPRELAEHLKLGRRFALVDVREDRELEICALPYTTQIPVGQLSHRIVELDREAETVVYCRSGVRSAAAANLLRGAGFRHVRNLEGGILAWIDDIDPTLAKY